MKLSIEKLVTGNVRVELAPDTASKPIVFTLSKSDQRSLIAILEAAASADRFKMMLELGDK